MNRRQQILEKFCGKDDLRTWMMSPIVIGDKVYATDSTVMIRMPREWDSEREPAEESIANKILGVKWPDQNIKINIPHLAFAFSKLEKELVYPSNECKCCAGDGTVDYEFEYDGEIYLTTQDCPICDGHGEIEDNSKEKIERHKGGEVFKIKDSFFSIEVLEKLLFVQTNTIELYNCFLVSQQSNRSASIFVMGDMEIILIPLTNSQDKNVITII